MNLIENMNKKLHRHKNKNWFKFLNKLLHGLKDDEVPAIGGQLTYFLILSIFPFRIFFLNILRYNPRA